MDSSRLRTGEVVAGIGGLALFVFLFFDWFSGGAELTGSVGNLSLTHTGVSGWDALTDLPGFLIILSGVSGIALFCLAAAGQRLNLPVRRGAFTAALGALAVLLILWRMLAGSPTLKIGIFLGLAAAVAITVGALMALSEDGFEVLVAVPDGRTRTAAASAPPATPSPAPAAKTSTGTKRAASSGASKTRKKAASGRSTTKRAAPKRSTAKRTTTKKKTSSSASTRKKTTSTRSRSSVSKSSSGKGRGSSRSSSKSPRSSGKKAGGMKK